MTRPGNLKYKEPGHIGVRAAFRVSYRRLSADQQRVMRLLSHNARYPAGRWQQVLEHAVWKQAVVKERWRMHDPVLLYAKEKAEKKASPDGAGEAVMRFLDYCLGAEFANDTKLRVLADDHPVGTFELHEELGCPVLVPAAQPHTDVDAAAVGRGRFFGVTGVTKSGF
jgi:hypothetical protein